MFVKSQRTKDLDHISCDCGGSLKVWRNLENSWAQGFERPAPQLLRECVRSTAQALDSQRCETLGFRHLQLAPLGLKLRSAIPTLSYNNYQFFNLIYRQAGKKMIMISYFSIALIVFLVWFKSFWNDTATSKNDLISWIVLVIGPLVWPVVLPLSILQITSKKSVVQTAQCEQEF
jgi:hypothetical protein